MSVFGVVFEVSIGVLVSIISVDVVGVDVFSDDVGVLTIPDVGYGQVMLV